MVNLANFFKKNKKQENFEFFRIGIASPDMIRSWSYGEVKKAETINYRTFKPERDGLFCSRIFGPVKDNECLCGRYKRVRSRGVVCEKCGVEVTLSKVRRERMGHIELAAPVAHIWFLKSLPSRIGLFLDMQLKDIEKILYFELFVVTDPGMTELERGQLLSDSEFNRLYVEHQGQFEVKIGAEAIQSLMRFIDLEKESQKIKEEISNTNADSKIKKLTKRYKLIQSFIKSNSKPEWMILEALPVLPPDLRPLIPMEGGGRFVTSDLNDLYRRVINRNVRLKKLLELNAPEIITRNEKRMLQEAVDALLENSRGNRPVTGSNKRPLKSLTDMIKGKQGRFRQNLLGKRVDYSGRSVIVVGPELKLHQCGIPKQMALELFKPFVYNLLQKRDFVTNIKQAKQLVEKSAPEVWDILEEVIRQHPVLLNRAPTLHRLGIQAFEPILIEGKAIQLHPLVCVAFNADFDGDQMAVHIPISVEAQLESRLLMMANNNILSPANGNPIIDPAQDVVLGCYYLTSERSGCIGEGKTFASPKEALIAYSNKQIDLHAKVNVRFKTYTDEDDSETPKYQIVPTTVGRSIFFLELEEQFPIEYLNKTFDKKALSALISMSYQTLNIKRTVEIADILKGVGFKYSTKSGVSVGIKDFVIPKEKTRLIKSANDKVQKLENDFDQGLITYDEKYNRAIGFWSRAKEDIVQYMMRDLGIETVEINGEKVQEKSFNPVFVMANSGARGSTTQLGQMSGMRGLMAKPDGSIIQQPITSNFREGLSVNEFFISTHGARKGLADTALKTANSGYLTRRLVDVAQDVVITNDDCHTKQGVSISSIVEGKSVVVPLTTLALGRVLAEEVRNAKGEIIFEVGKYIEKSDLPTFDKEAIQEVIVRSPITCANRKRGICAKCYGMDLARGTSVNIGEAVGIVAAQSIGEPGTQLTMRTFHVGGAASQGSIEDSIDAKNTGIVAFKNLKFMKNRNSQNIVLSRSGSVAIVDNNGNNRELYKIPYGAILYVKDGQHVSVGSKIVQWDPHNRPLIAEIEGKASFIDIHDSITVTEKMDELTGINSIQVIPIKERPPIGKNSRPQISIKINSNTGAGATKKKETKAKIKEASYFLDDNAILNVMEGADIFPGDILAKIPQEGLKTKDITGGLPRVADIFEARKPKSQAYLAPESGIVTFGKEPKEKRKLIITPNDQVKKPIEFSVPKWRQLNVYDGAYVDKGEIISDGELNLHDILKYLGIDELTSYIVGEVQAVYRLQGVYINDKHIEVILRQMLRKAFVIESGDSDLVTGEVVEYSKVLDMNDQLEQEGKRTIKFERKLLGITRASLSTESFISAASFQETTKVLTDAAIYGVVDHLKGLKENVLIGSLIPAGTGFAYHNKMADLRKENQDNKINDNINTYDQELMDEISKLDQGNIIE